MEKELLKKIIPSEKEKDRINKVINKIKKKILDNSKKNKLDVEVILGGSIAKETWLPKQSDIDLFVRFKDNKNISDLTEKLLKDFDVERVKGSRDYFNFQYKGFEIEAVPVLKINKPSEAKNITDISPLHVKWISNKIKKNKNLKNEIRLAKQFLKAQKCYGAESYIKGFSGHVTDILTYYYGSFDKLVKNAVKWKPKVFIDAEKHYKNRKEALNKMNNSKIYSPLIVVDPIQPERNASAALSKKKFNLLIKSAEDYLKNPDKSFFEEKRVTISDLKKGQGNLFVLESEPPKKRKDAAGAKLLKRFQKVKRKLKEKDFTILNSGWQWYPQEKAMYWFYIKEKELPKMKKHLGPPLNADKENIRKFKNKWKNVKKGKRYYVITKRKYTRPEQLIKEIKNMKIIKS